MNINSIVKIIIVIKLVNVDEASLEQIEVTELVYFNNTENVLLKDLG